MRALAQISGPLSSWRAPGMCATPVTGRVFERSAAPSAGYVVPAGLCRPLCQSALVKNIPLYRNSDLSYVSPIPAHLEGRSCVVTVASRACGGRGSVGHERSRAGRIALREPEASCGRAALLGSSRQHSSGSVDNAGGYCGEQASRAYGKTVWSWPSLLRSSSCGGGIRVNRRGVREFREAREARTNSAPGRARHKPSNHCAGKAVCWLHLYAAVQFFCVCIFAQRTVGASRHPAFPAPSWIRGWSDEAKLGRNAAARMRRCVCG